MHGVADLGHHAVAAQAIPGLHDLAMAGAAIGEECQAHPHVEHGRPGDAGDVSLVIGHGRLVVLLQKMRTGTDTVGRIDRADAHDLLAVRVHEARTLRHHAADEVLLGGHHLAHAEIAGGGGAIELATGHVALLDAHDGEGFHAIGADAEFLARLHHGAGHHRAVVGRYGQLIGMLAREGEAEQARRDAVHDGDLEGRHVGHGLVRHHEVVHQLLQRGARLRARHRHLRPLLGDRDIGHVEIGEQRLVGEFHLRHHLGGIGRGGGHHVMVLGEARGGAVVIDDAVLAQHEAVARLADGQRREGVAVELVEEDTGILALDVDLAERRDIADAH